MTDKANFITMLGKSSTPFTVRNNEVVVTTSGNDDKTIFVFNDEGNLINVYCNC